MNYYGQIDLTKLGVIARNHPSLVKKVKFSDGTEHMLLNVSVFELQNPDKFGNTATIKATCKKEEQVEGVIYYLGNLKNSEQKQHQQTQQAPANEETYYNPPQNPNDLPF